MIALHRTKAAGAVALRAGEKIKTVIPGRRKAASPE
jgi:hypothetical protein